MKRTSEGSEPTPDLLTSVVPGSRAVTLTDVARLAGVSVPTASRAVSGRGQVREETRERVLQAARTLSFSPNALAQGLLAGRSGTVGLLTSDLEGRFVLPILMGAEDAFGANSTSVLLCDARGDTIREQHHLRTLLARRVDGLIVVGSRTDPRPSLGQDLPVPVVYAYAPSDDPRDLSLMPDNVGAGRLAISHLVSMGRRRIAHITGQPDYQAATDRALGAKEELARTGLSLVGEVMYGRWSEQWGASAVRALLDQETEDFDAVLCGSDQIARGVLDALRDRGVRVPHDVAVMGFDNWEVMTTAARPPLTSIDMNFEQLGRTAAQRLFSPSKTPNQGEELMPCRVVARESTAPAA